MCVKNVLTALACILVVSSSITRANRMGQALICSVSPQLKRTHVLSLSTVFSRMTAPLYISSYVVCMFDMHSFFQASKELSLPTLSYAFSRWMNIIGRFYFISLAIYFNLLNKLIAFVVDPLDINPVGSMSPL